MGSSASDRASDRNSDRDSDGGRLLYGIPIMINTHNVLKMCKIL